MTPTLEKTRTLVLNADFRPLRVHPISTFSWQEAVTAVMMDRVTVLANYDLYVRARQITVPVPSVIALKSYVRLDRPAALTRQNLYALYGPNCAYCGGHFSTKELTLDHVIPKSRYPVARRHEANNFENLALACVSCNGFKGGRTPKEAGMTLRVKLRRPTVAEINREAMRFLNLEIMPKSWLDFLYWTSELE